MADIELHFINRSNDQNNSEIVIFQKNVATDFEEITVAWQVIKNLGQGWQHKLLYPEAFTVGAADTDGNQAPQQNAVPGQLWHITQTPHGHSMSIAGAASVNEEIQIMNELPQGTVDAQVYKDGKLLAIKTGVAPQQKAVFKFSPILWIGVISEVQEGAVIDSAIISDVNTEISLLGIKSADIVLTGGGTGPDATAFVFTLENIQMA